MTCSRPSVDATQVLKNPVHTAYKASKRSPDWNSDSPRVTLRPDERAQRWLLGVSASDRSGLLYAISRVLAQHNINLQLAKITTLGERVEDTFLIDGPALQQNRMQLQIETEMLDAISA